MKQVMMVAGLAALVVCGGCMTASQRITGATPVEEVAGFSFLDVDEVVNRAVESIVGQDRIKVQAGSNRAILVIPDVKNDTLSLGSQADALAQNLGQGLRERLTNSGRVVVYNPAVGASATVRVTPQYTLYGTLVQRNIRKDNGDFYKEYSLNLQLVDIATGLEFWQKRIPIRKLVDKANVMN